jgi:hypothetical protein
MGALAPNAETFRSTCQFAGSCHVSMALSRCEPNHCDPDSEVLGINLHGYTTYMKINKINRHTKKETKRNGV